MTVEAIRAIQQELFAEDVDIPYVGGVESMTPWTEQQVRTFFETAGHTQKPALPSAQDWMAALGDDEGQPSGAANHAPVDIHDDDDCEPLGGRRPPPAAAAPPPRAKPAAPPAPPPPPPRPKFMRPADFEDSAAPTSAESRKGYLPGVHAPRSTEGDEAAEAARERKREPLPALPGTNGVMTVDEAYSFLGVAREERADLDKLKARFRKMCLKWHPDKNRGREKQAAEVFQAVNAAYHFLTTNNFDYKRWQQSFTIPPMQSLDEVLLLALSGADPYDVEQLLRKRGEYRPHRDFGVNLSIPWNAGCAHHARAARCARRASQTRASQSVCRPPCMPAGL